jgi:acylphosphatase
MYARTEAERLALTGWVKNMPNGTVEILAEGTPEALCELRAWCRSGPPAARVTDVKSNFSTASGNFKNFTIAY